MSPRNAYPKSECKDWSVQNSLMVTCCKVCKAGSWLLFTKTGVAKYHQAPWNKWHRHYAKPYPERKGHHCACNIYRKAPTPFLSLLMLYPDRAGIHLCSFSRLVHTSRTRSSHSSCENVHASRLLCRAPSTQQDLCRTCQHMAHQQSRALCRSTKTLAHSKTLPEASTPLQEGVAS